MGWWGCGIMDGDTPLDYEYSIAERADCNAEDLYEGSDRVKTKAWAKLYANLRTQPVVDRIVAAIGDETDASYSRIYWQTFAVHLLRAGADITALKDRIIAAIDGELADKDSLDNWRDGGKERKDALEAFKLKIEAYDNKTPTDPVVEEGLLGAFAKVFGGKPN